MKNLFQSILGFILPIVLLASISSNAQSTMNKEDQIWLSGRVNCVNPINGTLSAVVVYNLNKKFGTMTDKDGKYSVRMSKNDTIMFSTAEHKEALFYLSEDDTFEDRTYNLHMIIDDIWLSTANIMGATNLEQFKQEIINADFPQGKPRLALPVVKKYIKLTPLSAAAIDLEGPLTYLQRKFSRFSKLKKQVK